MADRWLFTCPNCQYFDPMLFVEAGEEVTCDKCKKRFVLNVEWREINGK